MSDLKDIDDITLLSLDVTSIDSIRKAYGQVKAKVGEAGLDILVNNAGVAATMPALDHDMDAIRKMFETNVFGMMSMVGPLRRTVRVYIVDPDHPRFKSLRRCFSSPSEHVSSTSVATQLLSHLRVAAHITRARRPFTPIVTLFASVSKITSFVRLILTVP